MSNRLLLLLFFMIPLAIFAQDVKIDSCMAMNNLHVKEGWLIRQHEQDTVRHTIETYDNLGYRRSIEIFRDSTTAKYEYDFDDEVLIYRRTSFSDSLSSITKYYYNEQGLLKRTQDFDEKGNMLDISSVYKYDKKNKKKEARIILGNQIVSLNRYKYYKNGKLKAVKMYKYPNTIRYDKNGYCKNKSALAFEEIQTTESLDSVSQKRQTINKIQCNKNTNYLGATGFIEISKGDILRTTKQFNTQELQVYEIQFLNEVKIGEKFFRYRS